jgi:hypothetical protein
MWKAYRTKQGLKKKDSKTCTFWSMHSLSAGEGTSAQEPKDDKPRKVVVQNAISKLHIALSGRCPSSTV